jgi:hypothetical protein
MIRIAMEKKSRKWAALSVFSENWLDFSPRVFLTIVLDGDGRRGGRGGEDHWKQCGGDHIASKVIVGRDDLAGVYVTL